MRKIFCSILIGAFLFGSTAVLCSCSDNPEEDMSGEDISYVSEGDETADLLVDVITEYLTAISEQDHVSIMNCTTDDFVWNYNETAFYDYSRYITEFSLMDTDREHIMCEGSEYTVPVSYKLTYSSAHNYENGNSQAAGEYEYSRNFIIMYKEGKYLISDITERVMG